MVTVDGYRQVETILLIAADRREFAGFTRHLEGVRELSLGIDYAATGTRRGRRFVLAANGAGRALAARAFQAASRFDRPSVVVSTGFCGALDPKLAAGAVVDSRDGVVATANEVILSAEAKRRLRQETGADAVDMESAQVADDAAAAGLPFRAIRAVTDTAHEDLRIDLNAARDGDGRVRDTRVVGQALRRPLTGLPELVKLYRRSRLAAKNLGDYLAGCDF